MQPLYPRRGVFISSGSQIPRASRNPIYYKRGDRFIILLTRPIPLETRKWICPKLTHVTVSGIQDTDVRPIGNFARSRSDGQAKIPEGGKLLKKLAPDGDLLDLTRQLRLLMLSGLLGLLGLHPHPYHGAFRGVA